MRVRKGRLVHAGLVAADGAQRVEIGKDPGAISAWMSVSHLKFALRKTPACLARRRRAEQMGKAPTIATDAQFALVSVRPRSEEGRGPGDGRRSCKGAGSLRRTARPRSPDAETRPQSSPPGTGFLLSVKIGPQYWSNKRP